MKRFKLLIYLLLVCFFQSCKGQDMDIDQIIQNYDKIDFSLLKNSFIHFRSKGNSRISSIYFVSKNNVDCSPYVVEFDDKNKKVIEIKNHLVLKSCGKDYFTNDEIIRLITKFKEFNFYLIQVDDLGNVYINPNSQDLPTLLRVVPNALPADIDRFKVYKGNWYVRK